MAEVFSFIQPMNLSTTQIRWIAQAVMAVEISMIGITMSKDFFPFLITKRRLVPKLIVITLGQPSFPFIPH